MAGGPQAKISSGFRPFLRTPQSGVPPRKPVLPSSVALYIAFGQGVNFSTGTARF